ncbi:uncharacterized protein LOC120357561 [Solenopsis invicta]|uniref:uncharacterized protein LOC120357561 n=1 Tax=Solenopsis invicta TaxID=13686 RepID=UPI00193E9EFF|nr:uncharacterized protein LOC120357561 [Solenopsis invicta]
MSCKNRKSISCDHIRIRITSLLSKKNESFGKMKFVIFAIFVMIAMAMTQAETQQCSPWLQLCHVKEDCCRYLECSTYQAKCVPQSGLIIPGRDKRPLGPGPYPPNVPKEYLEE